jgi:hypothetical protein
MKQGDNIMTTSTSIINTVIKDGYTECFKAEKEGLYSPSERKFYQPHEIKIVNFYRFEGESDPGDSAILYILETNDGIKGTILDAYGAESSTETNNFFHQIEAITKKIQSAT